MADSFELLRARITIDVSNVKAAALEVAKLQASLNKLSKPIKINIGDTTRAARGAGTPAEKIAKATEAANQAELRSTQRTAREIERIRLESYKKILRAAQKLEIIAKSPATNERDRARLLAQAESLLIKVRQRVSAVSREAIQIERQLASVRRASQTGIDHLAAKLRSLANITDAASRAPGVSNFVGNIARLGSGLLRAVASISKLGTSTITLVAGIATMIVSLAVAASLMIKFAKATVDAAVAAGRAGLSLALQTLTTALKVILTPLRLAYFELRRLFNLAGMRAFISDTLDLAARMETVRKQLELGFGAGAEAEFQRLRQEANLFGTSLVDVSEAFAKFALVAKSSGIEIATIRRLFTGIQAEARVFGVTTDDMQGVLRAMRQVASKGRLMSEELTQQLAERLPDAFNQTARALNKSRDQLVEGLRAGTIGAKEFFEAFSTQAVLEFYDKAIALSGTLAARLQRLRNVADLIKIAFGNIFSDTLVFAVERIAQAAIRMRDAFAPIGNVFSNLAKRFQRSIASFNFEALFERLAQVLRGTGTLLRDFLQRLATIGIVFNGATLLAAFVAIKAAVSVLNDVMGSFLRKVKEFTGIDLSTPERAFAAIVAALDVLPLLIASATRIWIHFRTVANQFFADTLLNLKNLIKLWATAELIKNPAKAIIIVGALKQIDDIFEAMKKPLQDGSLTDTISTEINGMLEKIAKAQKNVQKVLAGEDGKGKNPAADALNQAAANIEAALKGEPADILSPIEFGRRLTAATFAVQAPEVQQQQKQAEDVAATARNTAEIADLIRRGGQATPLFGRMPGIV